jgi:hypothetical protein
MREKMKRLFGILLLALMLAVFLPISGPSVAETAKSPQVAQITCDPTYGGKYSGLLRKLNIPADLRQYGRCRDYGRWGSSSYRGFNNLPRGAFWTYSFPHWYLWARKVTAPHRLGACADPTFGGKYAGMVRSLRIPGDVRQYGRCRDYGRWSGNSYKGHRNLPNGFWVYSYPYWIIWTQER